MARTALVTGGNRGIGLETVRGLAEAGLTVWMGSRNVDDGTAAAAELGFPAERVRVVPLDVTDPAGIDSALAVIAGPVDVLVNNGGVWEGAPILDLTDEQFRNALEINTIGAWRLMKALLPGMVERGYGRVVNVTSGAGSFGEGMEGPPAYAASKAALNALTPIAARSVSGNIKVNAMCPGWVHTRMGGEKAPRTPKEGADTVIWLATLPDDGPTGGFFRDRKPIEW
jgi:NAD(P)-dependent dehydrogenase (short-subunit alcohol dehydrogenase family)